MKHLILAMIVLFTGSAFANTPTGEATESSSSGRIQVTRLSCLAVNGLSFTLAEHSPEGNLVNVGFGPVVGRAYYLTQASFFQSNHLLLTITDWKQMASSGFAGTYSLRLVGNVDQHGNYYGVGTADKTVVNVLTGLSLHSPPVGITCRALLEQK